MIKLAEFIKKYDGTIFILGLVLIAVLVSGMTNAFAGGVTDNNNGNLGDILVSTGQNNGASSVGTWTDPSFLKGNKGDTGAVGQQGIQGIRGLQGIQGIQGNQGIAGINGTNGLNGYTPIKNVDYFDGLNGINGTNGIDGKDGLNGKDVDPIVVNNLQNTDTTLQNNVNAEILDRQTADSQLGDRVDNVSNRVSKLERMQTKLQIGIRVYDSKRITVTPYISQNFTRGLVDEVGVRVTVKLGKSYEEKLIDKQNTRLSEIERKIGVAPVITQVVNEKGQTKSISITENGLVVKGKF